MTNKELTWEIIKLDPELVAWVREDPDLQHLLAECVSLFGVINVERDDEAKQSRRNRAEALRISNWFAGQGSYSRKRPSNKGRP